MGLTLPHPIPLFAPRNRYYDGPREVNAPALESLEAAAIHPNGYRSAFFTTQALERDLQTTVSSLGKCTVRFGKSKWQLLLERAQSALTSLLGLTPIDLPEIPLELVDQFFLALCRMDRKEAGKLTLVSKHVEVYATQFFFASLSDRQYLRQLLLAFDNSIPENPSPRLEQVASYVTSMTFAQLSGVERMRTVMKHCPNVTTMEVRDTLHRAMGWPPEQTSYEGISFPHLRHLSTDVSIWRTGATALPRSFSHSVYANLHTLFLSSPSLGSHAAVNNDAQYPLRLWDWSSLALLPHLRNLCITAESSNDEPHWSQAAKDIIVHRPPGLNNFVLLFPDERGSLPNSRHSGGEARKRLIRMMPDLVYGCVSTSPHPSPPVGLPGFVLWISIETLQNTWLDKLWDGAAHAKVAREEWPEKKSVAIETATQRLQKIVEKKAKRQTLRLEYAKREQELKGSKEPEVDERMKDIDPSSDLEESETIEEAIKELWDI